MHATHVENNTMPEIVPKGPHLGNKFAKGNHFGKFATS